MLALSKKRGFYQVYYNKNKVGLYVGISKDLRKVPELIENFKEAYGL